MMDCKQIREVLDLYIDHELSTEAMFSADVHLSECIACRRALLNLERMRHAVRTVVSSHEPPPTLERKVRYKLFSRWRPGSMLGIAASFLLLVFISAMFVHQARTYWADQLESWACRIDKPHEVMLEGKIECRDCKLHERYDVPAMCSTKGHHGALETPDGKIWNFLESKSSEALIHDATLLGKRIRVRGRLFRESGDVQVDSYQIL